MKKTVKSRKAARAVLVCILVLVAAIPVVGQEGKKYGKLYLKEYQPKTTEEQAILDVLMRYQGAFNAHDLPGFVSLFVKDGAYRPCGSISRPVASKACQDTLKYNFEAYGFETYYDPQISVDGTEANVKLLLESGAFLGDYTIWMRKVGQEWLVFRNDYTNVRSKGASY